MSSDIFKQQAAEYTVDTYIQSGMTLGLGVGSTVFFALHRLAEHLKSGRLKDIRGIPAGESTAQLARELGIPLTSFAEYLTIDVTFDGADEVDPALNLIKGAGGALLREKIVAQASRQQIIMIDAVKRSPVLGTVWSVPIEVIPFGWETQLAFLRALGGEPILRQKEGQPFKTDQGNLILDTRFGPIHDLTRLATQLSSRAGIVEHGLFLGLATALVVAGPAGINVFNRNENRSQ